MVTTFESELRDFFGLKYSLATATGSGSIFAALAGLGIGPRDEVIIPAFGWYTVFNGPAHLGALPVLAEVDHSINLDIDDVERRITERTRAVIVIHFQGASHGIERLRDLCARRGIHLLEDCAQACGARVRGKPLGTFGAAGCFSLQQNKILCTGDGGFLVTDDVNLYERAVRYHDHGVFRAQHGDIPGSGPNDGMIGLQFRMNELTGAVALAQLRKLEPLILNRTRLLFRSLRDGLLRNCPGVEFRPTDDPEGDAGISLFLKFPSPEAAAFFRKAMVAEGIRIGPSSNCLNLTTHPMAKFHRMANPNMPPFGRGCAGEGAVYREEDYPQTAQVLATMAAIAITPQMTGDDIGDIVEAATKVWPHLPA